MRSTTATPHRSYQYLTMSTTSVWSVADYWAD